MEKIPEIRPGDLVKVYSKVIEGEKERIAPFQGVVIHTKGSGTSKTFTVRKVSAGIGIERIFLMHSPLITKIEIKKKGRVRRAKLSYLRHKRAKKMKLKETAPEQIPGQAAPPDAEEKIEGEKVEGAPGAKTVEKV